MWRTGVAQWPSPAPPGAECLEFIVALEDVFSGEDIDSIAINPALDKIVASYPGGPTAQIGIWDYPSGDYDAVFGDGEVFNYDDAGDLYWCDRYTDVGTDSHIRVGTASPGAVIYSSGGNYQLQGYWHDDEKVYFLENRNATVNRICRIDEAGGGFEVLYDDTTIEVQNGPWITADGAVWFYGTNSGPDPFICRLAPSTWDFDSTMLPGALRGTAIPSGNELLYCSFITTPFNIDAGLRSDTTTLYDNYDCLTTDAHPPFVTPPVGTTWSQDRSLMLVQSDHSIFRSND